MVTGPMPDLPETRESQNGSTPAPIDESTPMPVTATRTSGLSSIMRGGLPYPVRTDSRTGFFLQVGDDVSDGGKFFGVSLGDFPAHFFLKLVFERHD